MALALATSPAAAQQIIAEYRTMLGPHDMRNASGARLTDLCAIVQQDRANYHRFGMRDELDSFDAAFSDPAMRAKMSGTSGPGTGMRAKAPNGA
ncbi:MAG: hypothetical protein AAGP08_06930 [Pseudomonadota bacterium]